MKFFSILAFGLVCVSKSHSGLVVSKDFSASNDSTNEPNQPLKQEDQSNGASQSAFNSLPEHLQEIIVQQAFDKKYSTNKKMGISATSKSFFHASMTYKDDFYFAFSSLYLNGPFSEVKCQALKEKKSATLRSITNSTVEKFKYFHCFENLESLKILAVNNGLSSDFLHVMPKLKSIYIDFCHDIIRPSWQHFPRMFPKQIETIEMAISFQRNLFINLDTNLWNQNLNDLNNLKTFKISLNVVEFDAELWKNLFDLSKSKLNHLDLTVIDSNWNPLHTIMKIYDEKPENLTVDRLTFQYFKSLLSSEIANKLVEEISQFVGPDSATVVDIEQR